MFPLRPLLGLLFVAVAMAPLASGHGNSSIHSANVVDAHHIPALPVAGQPVSIHVYVDNDTKIDSVRAIYCRVQRYACAPVIRLISGAPLIYDGLIPWDLEHAKFFRGVTEVGYKFEIRYIDGANETTPLMHFPARPVDLPPGGDIYYYYTLEPAPESPSPGILPVLALAVLALLAWRRRQ